MWSVHEGMGWWMIFAGVWWVAIWAAVIYVGVRVLGNRKSAPQSDATQHRPDRTGTAAVRQRGPEP